jgi:hypothetical protein
MDLHIKKVADKMNRKWGAGQSRDFSNYEWPLFSVQVKRKNYPYFINE